VSGLIVGIDVGGTFTDVVAVDPEGRRTVTLKVPSEPRRPAKAFLNGLEAILVAAGQDAKHVERIVHGTTIATNAVLEQRGATLGILTTQGFEDILAIGRMKRAQMYDWLVEAQEPLFLAPRRRIRGIPERVDATGSVVHTLDEQAVIQAVRRLRDEEKISAIAVCYLFSFLNPAHERRTAEVIRAEWPDLEVSLSSEVDPQFREYERLVVTAFDAYLRPVISGYVNDLEAELRAHGFTCPMQIMQSNGGITSAQAAAERPVGTVLSGPAAGVVAGEMAGRLAGFEDVVTLDMGGTSFDVALVRRGHIETGSEGRLGRYPLRVPMVDVHTIGAGGGSIARLDAAGGLRVGPESAGADPGPACYGRGGREATVTDASIVLGYLNPATYAGGRFPLQPHLATEIVRTRVAEPLGLELARAAAGIHEIVNTQMAEAVRLVSLQRGYDLRGIALVAMGGAGPVHAGRLLKLLQARAVVVPARPGVSSAYGLLLAQIRHEAARPYPRLVQQAEPAAMRRLFEEMDAQCRRKMQAEGVPLADVRIERYAEMRYVGQSFELRVLFPTEGKDALAALLAEFHLTHDRVYGHHSPDTNVEILALRAVHLYQLPAPPADPPPPAGAPAKPAGARRTFFAELGGYVDGPVYRRAGLAAGARVKGPAIVDQEDTTTVVYPGQTASVHPSGTLIIRQDGE
jgi:N-methylhydantoinase A/oxoprolinase/acetone carboxylase beta subunit